MLQSNTRAISDCKGEKLNMDELILKERKLREDIESLINDSKLPAILLKPMAMDLLNQIETLEQIQFKNALANKDRGDSTNGNS